MNYEVEDSKIGYIVARVVTVHRELLKVICMHGEVSAKLKSGVYYSGLTEELIEKFKATKESK